MGELMDDPNRQAVGLDPAGNTADPEPQKKETKKNAKEEPPAEEPED